jgi:hypothetical protein
MFAMPPWIARRVTVIGGRIPTEWTSGMPPWIARRVTVIGGRIPTEWTSGISIDVFPLSSGAIPP